MKRWLCATLSVLMISTSAPAAPVGDSVVLRRLSMHLRGRIPNIEEYKALNAATDRAAFLDLKAAEYMKDAEFVKGLRFRLFERIRFQNPSHDSAPSSAALKTTEMILSQDRPWDDLWLTKTYRYTVLRENTVPFNRGIPIFQNISDSEFFSELKPQKTVSLGKIDLSFSGGKQVFEDVEVSYPESDDRLAGLWTTPRFVARFSTSGLNKNRRRAAVLFRVLLCDPMSVALESGEGVRRDEIDALFEKGSSSVEDGLRRELESSPHRRHGQEAACMACHYKLDPMGQNLQSLGSTLAAIPFPGALVFKGRDSRMVSEQVQGVGALVRKIVAQPEYASCQAKWFWEQYIGTDVPLSTERHREITEVFDKVGRKPRAFIRYLVQQSEFRTPPLHDEEVTFARVKPLLERCDRCHDGEGLPSMASERIGFSGSLDEHKQWVRGMKDRLDRPDHDRKKMPRNWREWDPQDLTFIKRWLQEGANHGI